MYVARTPRKENAFVGVEEIQFLSSVPLPNLRQALRENFLDSDSEYENISENILDKSQCGEDASDMSNEDFPVRRMKRLRAKRRPTTKKELKANQAGKGKDIPKIYFL